MIIHLNLRLRNYVSKCTCIGRVDTEVRDTNTLNPEGVIQCNIVLSLRRLISNKKGLTIDGFKTMQVNNVLNRLEQEPF